MRGKVGPRSSFRGKSLGSAIGIGTLASGFSVGGGKADSAGKVLGLGATLIPCPVGKLHISYIGFLQVECWTTHQNPRRGMTLIQGCRD